MWQKIREIKRKGSLDKVAFVLGKGGIEFKPVEVGSEQCKGKKAVTERLPAEMLKMF